MSDQPVGERATYTTHDELERRRTMPSKGFEPAIPAIRRPQTYALNRAAIRIGDVECTLEIITSDAENAVFASSYLLISKK
jgi:hypothetical protein